MRPFIVCQNGRVLFTVHARSLKAARAIVTARLADTAGITISAPRK